MLLFVNGKPQHIRIVIQRKGETKIARDVVCGMSLRIPSGEVDESMAAAKSEYKGKTYYFCATGCKVAFDKEPEKYVSGKQSGSNEHSHMR